MGLAAIRDEGMGVEAAPGLMTETEIAAVGKGANWGLSAVIPVGRVTGDCGSWRPRIAAAVATNVLRLLAV